MITAMTRLLPPRRLLYLDANGMSAYRWQGGQLRVEAAFQETQSGREAFAAYLTQHARCTFTLLADVGGEGFQLERLPPVRGREREALLHRRFAQYCPGTPLRVALTLGRETSGRRDEKVLLAAMTQPQNFEPWLATLRQNECRLAGIYSLSLLAERLAAASITLRATGSRIFLMCVQTRVGLRQFVFEDGRLTFSRLTPLAGNTTDAYASSCVVESARMRDYLLGQHQAERDEHLPVVLLHQPAEAARLREICRDSDCLDYSFAAIPELAGKLGIRNFQQDVGCADLFMQILMKRPPRRQFAPDGERLFYRLQRFQWILHSAGTAILLAGLLFSGRQLIEFDALRARTELLRTQAADGQRRYADIHGALPTLPLDSAELRALIDHFDESVRQSALPQFLYRRIGEALGQVPQVELQRIDWQSRGDADAATRAGNAAASQRSSGISAEVHVELPLTLNGDERAMESLIDSFIAGLRKGDGLQVRILRRPHESESINTFLSDSDAKTHGTAPKFSLQLILPPPRP
jgi:hypothetical protein